MKAKLLFITIILQIGCLYAKVELPSVLSDNMVLQQNSDVKLWGRASGSKKIRIKTSWDKSEKTTIADEDGNWEVSVKTILAGGPYAIQFDDGDKLTLSNVYLGEVWFCSGQSNMEMPVKGFISQPVIH